MVNNLGNIFFLLFSLMGWKIRKRRRQRLLCLFGSGAARECEWSEHGWFHSLLHGCVAACCGGETALLSQDNVCMFTCCPPFVLSVNLLSCFSRSYSKWHHEVILSYPIIPSCIFYHPIPSSVPAERLETLSNVRKCIHQVLVFAVPSVVAGQYQVLVFDRNNWCCSTVLSLGVWLYRVMFLDSTKCWCSTVQRISAGQ